jgi:hypothetical protein
MSTATIRPTTIHLDILKSISIASPCEARWEDMVGDEKVRHCTLCALNVHNLSAMSREEAEELVRSKIGDPSRRVCVRFYERADGTVLTQDCPRGLAAIRARVRRTAGRAAVRIAAVIGLTGLAAAAANGGGTGGAGTCGRGSVAVRNSAAVRWVVSKLNPAPPAIMGKMRMGDFAAPVPTPRATLPAPAGTSGAAGRPSR